MEKTAFYFENSYLNLNIDLEDVMISSFPNRLVIGEPYLDGYKKSKSFYFCLHEVKVLFLMLCKCIMYVTFEKNDSIDKVLNRSETEVYYWEGFEVIHSNENQDEQIERKFKLVKKENNIDSYEIIFTLSQTETLINVISDLVLTAMCLKFEDRKVIDDLMENKLLILFESKEDIANKIVSRNHQRNVSHIVDLIFFYKDLFQLLNETNELKQKLKHPQFYIDQINSEQAQN